MFRYSAFLLPLLFSSPGAAQEAEITSETKDGRLLYEAWCSRCHGMDGRGNLEDLQLDTPVPDLADCSFNSREPRRDWKAVIMHGGPARGLSMTMPAWSEALTEEQVDAIIAHLKTLCRDDGWPQGELSFRRAQVTGKAFPENEALLIPTYTGNPQRHSVMKLVYEERIGPRGQWEVSAPFVSAHYASRESGIGDVEAAGKYALFHDAASLTILSLGLEVVIPTGKSSVGLGSGMWKLSPFFAAAKGYELLTIQSSVKLEQPLRKDPEAELSYNLAVTVPFTEGKQGFFPAIELNGIKSVSGPANTLLLTPQLYAGLVKRGHIALSLGVQLPVAGTKPFEYRIVSFLLWEYADGGLWW